MFVNPTVVMITGSRTLKRLYVGLNNIGDDGILMISENFLHNNSLINLDVGRSGLSVKGEEVTIS